jgi:hypothetical protein
MKRILSILLFAGLCITLCVAQDAPSAPAPLTNIYAAGVSYNSSGSPSIAGTGLYAHSVSDSTYAFTVADALPASVRPFAVTTNFGAGIAQKVFTLPCKSKSIPIYVPSSAGISYTGSNTGWAWSTGALAVIRLKDNYMVMPHVRLVKSSVSNGTGYQPVIGALFGWGH